MVIWNPSVAFYKDCLRTATIIDDGWVIDSKSSTSGMGASHHRRRRALKRRQNKSNFGCRRNLVGSAPIKQFNWTFIAARSVHTTILLLRSIIGGSHGGLNTEIVVTTGRRLLFSRSAASNWHASWDRSFRLACLGGNIPIFVCLQTDIRGADWLGECSLARRCRRHQAGTIFGNLLSNGHVGWWVRNS